MFGVNPFPVHAYLPPIHSSIQPLVNAHPVPVVSEEESREMVCVIGKCHALQASELAICGGLESAVHQGSQAGACHRCVAGRSSGSGHLYFPQSLKNNITWQVLCLTSRQFSNSAQYLVHFTP